MRDFIFVLTLVFYLAHALESWELRPNVVEATMCVLGFGLESSHVELESMIIFIMYFFGFGLRCGLSHFQNE